MTCPFLPVWLCFAVSSHALALAVIAVIYVLGFAAFLYLACRRRPRAREGEEVIKRWSLGVT